MTPADTGPELIIDHVILMQLSSMEEFYAALPAGCQDLEALGRAAYQAALKAAQNGNCAACRSLRDIMRPVQTALGQRLRAVQHADAGALEPLAELISRKRGYRPLPLVLIYKGVDHRPATLTF